MEQQDAGQQQTVHQDTAQQDAGQQDTGQQDTGQQDTGQQDRPAWRILLRPRWLAWHAFAAVAFVGMFWLGDWQLHRALSGNELSWAYTFEWPLFAVAGAYFWVRTLREELHLHRTAASPDEPEAAEGDGTHEASAGAPTRGVDAVAEQAAAEARVARLRAEIQSDPRWRARSRGRR
jgi:hypothetical protein